MDPKDSTLESDHWHEHVTFVKNNDMKQFFVKRIKGLSIMKIVAPKPFTFGNGKRAVLLLHGFTGNTADVRMLARFLEKKGYTCHAPLYKGHGVPPEELSTYRT